MKVDVDRCLVNRKKVRASGGAPRALVGRGRWDGDSLLSLAILKLIACVMFVTLCLSCVSVEGESRTAPSGQMTEPEDKTLPLVIKRYDETYHELIRELMSVACGGDASVFDEEDIFGGVFIKCDHCPVGSEGELLWSVGYHGRFGDGGEELIIARTGGCPDAQHLFFSREETGGEWQIDSMQRERFVGNCRPVRGRDKDILRCRTSLGHRRALTVTGGPFETVYYIRMMAEGELIEKEVARGLHHTANCSCDGQVGTTVDHEMRIEDVDGDGNLNILVTEVIVSPSGRKLDEDLECEPGQEVVESRVPRMFTLENGELHLSSEN